MNEREYAAAKLSELEDGEMKEVAVGETKILLARVNGKCYAVGANCPHYGAPLVEGALSGERVSSIGAARCSKGEQPRTIWQAKARLLRRFLFSGRRSLMRRCVTSVTRRIGTKSFFREI